MCFKNTLKNCKNGKAYKENQDIQQKKHAILQIYIMMYMVLIVYYHMFRG